MRKLCIVVIALLLASACTVSASFGGDTVSTDKLEEKVTTFLSEKAGATAGTYTVDCPDELAGEKGAETECTVTYDSGNTQPVTVTYSDDGKIHMLTGEVVQAGDGTGDGGTDTGS